MAVSIQKDEQAQVAEGIQALVARGEDRGESNLWLDAWRRLTHNKAAVAGMVVIGLLLLITLFASWLAPHHYADQDLLHITESPNMAYPLGTDQLGRDVLSRVLYGARISITVGIVAQLILLSIGVPLGMLAGYFGGWLDILIMRLVDILFAIPDLLLVILVMTYLRSVLAELSEGPWMFLVRLDGLTGGLLGVFIALGAAHWLTVARLVRGQVLSIRQEEYIEAARCVGASPWRIMWRHCFPNTLAPIIIATTFGIPRAIMLEAGLSFLGLGVRPPMPSWGMMIAEGVDMLRSYPHLLTAPAVALALTLLSFNFLGDGLRDALDPWMKAGTSS